MSQLSLAMKFGRVDVDKFLDEITAELYQEWQDFLLIQSGGFKAAPREQTPEQVEMTARMWAGMLNAKAKGK